MRSRGKPSGTLPPLLWALHEGVLTGPQSDTRIIFKLPGNQELGTRHGGSEAVAKAEQA